MAQQKTMFDDWGKRELVQPDASRLEREAAAKEDVLDLLEGTRKSLIDAGREIAMSIWRRRGRVTSTDVLEELRSGPFADTLDGVDPRFMGAVFRSGWTRIGYDATGSHCRPVSVWTRQ